MNGPIPQKGITGRIVINFNTATGETQVSAAMDTQEMKNLSIGVLLQAIQIILHYKASAILRPTPAAVPPLNGNGVTH